MNVKRTKWPLYATSCPTRTLKGVQGKAKANLSFKGTVKGTMKGMVSRFVQGSPQLIFLES